MELHDYDAERALADLVDRATSQRQDAVDPELLHRIKSTCKSSQAAIRTIYDLLYTRLKKPHSQVRLLALDISAELFHRSALFRSLLAAKFPLFLGLVLGFKTNDPLPAPTDVAGRLRRRALELIEKWHTDYGTRYPQIALGYAYIRDTLRFEFPQIDARREAEAEAERQREARAQQIAQERYQMLLAEWQGQATECRSLINQFSEAFALLDKQSNAPTNVGNTRKDGEEEEEEEDWEDVDGAEEERRGKSTHAGGVSSAAATEGLAAYAAGAYDDADQDTLENTLDKNEVDSALESVIETLDGVYKLICNQALPGVQEALRVIVRAEAGTPGEAQYTQHERLLRAATSIKAELTAAKESFEGAHLDLAALAQAQVRRREEREKRNAAAHEQKKKREENQKTKTEEVPSINPYHYIKDPAAPLKPFLPPGRSDAGSIHRKSSNTAGSGNGNGIGGGGSSRNNNTYNRTGFPVAPQLQQNLKQHPQKPRPPSSSTAPLPESVKQSLASRAPVLPAGPFIRVWDSNTGSGNAAPQFINSNGLEVANHWGPVDVHTELPSDRLEEMFLYAPPSERLQPNSTGEKNSTRATVPPGRAPSKNNNTNKNTGTTPTAAAGNDNNNSALGTRLLHGVFIPPSTTEGRRAERAAERAYNDAVISAAAVGGDEALAQALETGDGFSEQQQRQQEQEQQGGRKKRKAGGATAKERLQRKLLSGSARAAALADSNAADNERQREKFSNRWENR